MQDGGRLYSTGSCIYFVFLEVSVWGREVRAVLRGDVRMLGGGRGAGGGRDARGPRSRVSSEAAAVPHARDGLSWRQRRTATQSSDISRQVKLKLY